jgi:PAS domain S-box-containing protein
MDRVNPTSGLGSDASGPEFEAVWQALLAAAQDDPPDLVRLEAIARHLPWTVTLKDRAGRLLAANPLVHQLADLPPESMLGRTYDELAADHPHLALQSPSVRAADEAAWAVGHRITFLRNQLSRDGQLLTLRVHKQRLADAEGGRRSVLSVAGFLATPFAADGQHIVAEHLYRLLADHSSDLVCLLEPDGRCRYVSPSLQRLLGVDPATWIGQPLADHADPAEAAALAEWQRDAAAGHAGATLRLALRGRDGRQRIFDARLTPLREDAGRPDRITGVVLGARDITESQAALEALQATDRRLALGLDMTRVGVFDIDLERGTAWFSPEFERLLGHPPGEFARTWDRWDLTLHPDDFERGQRERRALLKGECDAWDFDVRHRRAAGDYLWMRSRGQVLERGPDGRVQRLIGTLQDIDERVQQTEALRHVQQRLELALRVSHTGIAELDPVAGRVRADRTLGQILSLGPEQLEGPLEAFMALVDPVDVAHAQRMLEQALQGQSIPLTTLRVQRADDGQTRWLELSLGTMQGATGLRIVGAAWDATERCAAEQRLREAGQREAFLLRLGDAFQPLDDPVAVVQTAARLLAEHLQVQRAGMSRIEGDGAFVVADWTGPDMPALPRRMSLSSFGDAVAELHRRGDTLVCEDIATDPRLDASERAAYAAQRIAAVVRVMLRQHGHWVAAFGVHAANPRQWTATQVDLIREVAERTWSYAEQVRAQQTLRASEARYRALFDTMSEGFTVGELVFDGQGRVVDLRYLELNRAFESLTGLSREQCLGRRVGEVIPGLDPSWSTAVARAVDTGVPQRFESFVPGLGRWYEATAFAFGPQHFGMLYDDITQRKQSEADALILAHRQAFLVQLGDLLRPSSDPDRIQYEAARLLGEHLGADRVGYAEDGGDGESMIVTRHHSVGMPSLIGRHRLADFAAALGRHLAQGRTMVWTDSEDDPALSTAERARHAEIAVRAGIDVPLLKAGQLSALLFVHSRWPRTWAADEVSLAEEVAERVWSAIERSRAEVALRASEQRQAFLVRLSDALRLFVDPRLLQQEAARLLADHLGASRVAWSAIDGDEAVATAVHSRGVPPLPPRMALADFGAGILAAYRAGQTLAVGDVMAEPRIDRLARASYRADQIAAFAGQMLMRDGQWVAVFEVHQSSPRRWTTGEVDLVREVAERIWAASQRARAEAALRESEARQQFLLALSDALAPVRDPKSIQAIAARHLGERLHAQRACYFGVEGREYVVETDYTRGAASVVGRHAIDPLGPIGRGIAPGDIVVIDDVGSWPGFTDSHRRGYAAVQIAAFIGVPLVKDGRVVAGLAVHASAPRRWTAAEVALAREVAERTWAAVERSRAERSLAAAQERLRDLAARLDVEREQERQRIALDVHDELGQQLTAIKLQLGLLESRLDGAGHRDPQAARDSVRRTHELLDTTIEVTRDIAARLRVPGHGLGLASGIAALAEEFSLRSELPCEVRSSVDGDAALAMAWTDEGTEPETDPEIIDAAVPESAAGPLLRIVQESLTNVSRHAQARHVTIAVALSADRLKLDIADDGRGFDPDRVPGGRLGLVGMRERATRIGATIDWRRNDPCGTIVRIRWPRAAQETP